VRLRALTPGILARRPLPRCWQASPIESAAGPAALEPAAWAHAVDIDGAKLHYHKRSTELYYVLDGEGSISLDGVDHPIHKGSMVHIPPGVIHGARGRMRVLVIGIPDIAEADYFEAQPNA